MIDIVPREEIHKTGNQEQVPQTGQAQVVNQAAPVSNNGQSQAIQLTSSGSNGSNGQVSFFDGYPLPYLESVKSDSLNSSVSQTLIESPPDSGLGVVIFWIDDRVAVITRENNLLMI